jgi:type II secretory pathway component PulL
VSKRPFFVLPDGQCIPLEGDWRAVELRGDWYVLGQNSVVPCGSQRAAHSVLEQLLSQTDADRLASEAIERLDQLPTIDETERLEEF